MTYTIRRTVIELVAGALFLCFAGPALSGTAWDKYYNFLPEEIVALGEGVIKSEVPLAFALYGKADVEAALAGSILALDILHYPSVHEDTERAVELFQQDLKESVTGKLTVGQMDVLRRRSIFYQQSLASIAPTGTGYSSMHDLGQVRMATIEGQLEIVGAEKIAFPINKMTIECLSRTMTCQVSQIDIQLKSSFDNATSDWGSTIFVDSNSWELSIIEWNDTEILARPSNVGACRTVLWSLDFDTEQFTEVTRNNGTKDEFCDAYKLDAPRLARIITSNKLFANRARFNLERYRAGLALTYSGFNQKHGEALARALKISGS